MPGTSIAYMILFLAKLPPLTHKVVQTAKKGNTVTPEKVINPTAVHVKTHRHNSLDFALGKATNENDICVYSMQVCPLQQDLTTEPVSDKISESSDLIPPRILQSVHGYFNLRCDHPTRINLSASWDPNTVNCLHFLFTDYFWFLVNSVCFRSADLVFFSELSKLFV